MAIQRLITGIIFFVISYSVTAEVQDLQENSFRIKFEKVFQGAPKEAYDVFLDVDKWWDKEHSWWGQSSVFSIEQKANGCFCEVYKDKSVAHLRVVFVDPGKEVRFVGGLGPLQAMAFSGSLTIRFDELENGRFKLTHDYLIFGPKIKNVSGLAAAVDKVQNGQLKRFEEYFLSTMKKP